MITHRNKLFIPNRHINIKMHIIEVIERDTYREKLTKTKALIEALIDMNPNRSSNRTLIHMNSIFIFKP